MTTLNQGIIDTIDAAVLKCYPDYAEASKISALIEDIAMGTLAFFDTYGMRRGYGFTWKPGMPEDVYANAIADSKELSDIAMMIRRAINSSSDETLAIVRSEFSDHIRAYYTFCHLLINLLGKNPRIIF